MHLLLLLTILIPLGGALMIAGLAEAGRPVVRTVALLTTLLTLALAATIVSQYEPPVPADPVLAELQAAERQTPYAYAADGSRPDEFAVSKMTWLHAPADGAAGSGLDLEFSLGLDGLSIWLFGLSALLMVTAVLVSWEAVHERARGFYATLLILEMGLLGVFAARDIILFYVFFEFTLVPLVFLIGIWGSEERRYAAMKFFLFTFAGSALTFLGLVVIVLWHAGYVGAGAAWRDKYAPKLTFNISQLSKDLSERGNELFKTLDQRSHDFIDMPARKDGMLTKQGADAVDGPRQAEFERLDANGDGRLTLAEFRAGDAQLQLWIFLALFVGFAVKVPLVPLHTWLPLAHTQAPTAGSVLLAGVLLKLGSYGFVRLCLPLTPDACLSIGAPLVGGLAVIGIIYGALCALAQDDIKKL